MGDTPVADAAAELGIQPSFRGGGFDTGGLLSPVMSAFLAVAEGRARHVLVYRTVQMMGGTVLSAGAAPADEDPAPQAAPSAATPVLGAVGSLLAHHPFWAGTRCGIPRT